MPRRRCAGEGRHSEHSEHTACQAALADGHQRTIRPSAVDTLGGISQDGIRQEPPGDRGLTSERGCVDPAHLVERYGVVDPSEPDALGRGDLGNGLGHNSHRGARLDDRQAPALRGRSNVRVERSVQIDPERDIAVAGLRRLERCARIVRSPNHERRVELPGGHPGEADHETVDLAHRAAARGHPPTPRRREGGGDPFREVHGDAG